MPTAELVSMSAQELDRLTVIERVLEKQLSQVEAGKQLGITPRYLRRMIERYPRDRAAGLVSMKRGKRGNRAYPEAVKSAVIALVRQLYHAARYRVGERDGASVAS